MNREPTLSPLRGIAFVVILLVGVATGTATAGALNIHGRATAEGTGGGAETARPQAAGVAYVTPDTTADPHWKDFHYPIYLRNPQGQPVCDRSTLHITVSYYATLFYIRSVSPGTMTRRQEGDSIVVEIDLSGTSALQEGKVVELIGDVLVGSEQSTQMHIRSITCSGAPITDSIYNGYLALGPGFCEEGSDRLIVYTEPFSITKVAPNPSAGSLTVSVTTIELDETWLEVYALDGRRVFATTWTPASTNARDMTRDIVLPDDIPSGAYRLVLRSPARRDTRPLVITR